MWSEAKHSLINLCPVLIKSVWSFLNPTLSPFLSAFSHSCLPFTFSSFPRFLMFYVLLFLSWQRHHHDTPGRSLAPQHSRKPWRRSSSTLSSCWPRGTWSGLRWRRPPAIYARWRRSWVSSRHSTYRYKIDVVTICQGRVKTFLLLHST